jgi:hypothetical protein
MSFNKKRLAGLIFVYLCFGGLVALVTKEWLAPYLIRRHLISVLGERCETCQLSMGRIRFSFIPFLSIAVNNLQFRGGTRDATAVSVEIKQIRLTAKPASLFSTLIELGRIEIDSPNVLVVDGDLEMAPENNKNHPTPSAREVEVKGIATHNGTFTYVREHLGNRGIVNVSQIEAETGPLGTSLRLGATALAKGLLESSGRFELGVQAMLFSEEPDVSVKLEIADQNLSELNHFFGPNDGIHLTGKLIRGRSEVQVLGEQLTSYVQALYRDFNVHVGKNKERGSLSAFFQNLLVSAKTEKQNVRGRDFDRTGQARIR